MPSAQSSSQLGPLVTAEWLAEHLKDPQVKIVDLRWYLGEPGRGHREYSAGHIPGAVFIDLDSDISASQGAGRHPIPSPGQFQEAMRRAGINRGDFVVVYDDASASVAARLWWLLRIHGHPDVAVLDGGLQTWSGPLEQSSPAINPGNFEAAPPDLDSVLQYEEVRSLDEDAVILDARAPERYTGETEPVDPVAGHIPGAQNAFWKENLGPEGKFLGPDELRKKYSRLGVGGGKAVMYCGSGVTSCHNLIAIELAGLGPARLYAGSWSDWSARADAPVATGDKS
jgi:thiosulfate/3-mercaptopyruvate sulfurtransferase